MKLNTKDMETIERVVKHGYVPVLFTPNAVYNKLVNTHGILKDQDKKLIFANGSVVAKLKLKGII